MSDKKRHTRSPKIFLPDYHESFGDTHLMEHIHFLEERTSMLETKVDTLREVFTTMLELNNDEDEEGEEEEDDD